MALSIFLINLDRSPERLARMDRQLRSLGLAYQRVPAVDGKNDPAIASDVDPGLYRRVHGRDVRVGEIGCFKSHLKTMQAFLETGHDYGLIIEDDATLGPALPTVLSAIAAEPPGVWDTLKLESRRRGYVLTLRQLDPTHVIGVNLFRSTGAAAYVVTRAAAERYLATLWPMTKPFDHAFDRGPELGLRVRELRPLPVSAVETGVPSTIELPTDRPRKVGPLLKCMVLAHRTRTEVARFLWGIGAWSIAKLPRR